jgi:hypothetical protein
MILNPTADNPIHLPPTPPPLSPPHSSSSSPPPNLPDTPEVRAERQKRNRHAPVRYENFVPHHNLTFLVV